MDFTGELQRVLAEAKQKGLPNIRVNAGELHRRAGGYPGPHHRMPMCCSAMKRAMKDDDRIVEQPPSGVGASLTIEYRLNNNQQEIFSSNSLSNSLAGSKFENTAFEYFKAHENIVLDKNFEISLGLKLKKTHQFDLGDRYHKILVECKAHTWTESGNTPSAKISVWNEAMFYFELVPKDYKKIFFVLMDYCQKKRKTLLQYYIENYYHFIPTDVIFYEYYSNDGHCEIYDFEKIENIIKNKGATDYAYQDE
jgi:hypothetical protein